MTYLTACKARGIGAERVKEAEKSGSISWAGVFLDCVWTKRFLQCELTFIYHSFPHSIWGTNLSSAFCLFYQSIFLNSLINCFSLSFYKHPCFLLYMFIQAFFLLLLLVCGTYPGRRRKDALPPPMLFPCPICQQDVELGERGLTDCLRNLTLERIVERCVYAQTP